jgi:hypothetical protein
VVLFLEAYSQGALIDDRRGAGGTDNLMEPVSCRGPGGVSFYVLPISKSFLANCGSGRGQLFTDRTYVPAIHADDVTNIIYGILVRSE